MSAAEGLSLTAYEILLRLAQADGNRLRMQKIAEALLISRSGLTGMVNDLERRGYVQRQRATSEGRGVEAWLTASGKGAFRRAQRVHLAGVRERFLRHLSDEQLSALADIWTCVGTDTAPDLPAGKGR